MSKLAPVWVDWPQKVPNNLNGLISPSLSLDTTPVQSQVWQPLDKILGENRKSEETREKCQKKEPTQRFDVDSDLQPGENRNGPSCFGWLSPGDIHSSSELPVSLRNRISASLHESRITHTKGSQVVKLHTGEAGFSPKGLMPCPQQHGRRHRAPGMAVFGRPPKLGLAGWHHPPGCGLGTQITWERGVAVKETMSTYYQKKLHTSLLSPHPCLLVCLLKASKPGYNSLTTVASLLSGL